MKHLRTPLGSLLIAALLVAPLCAQDAPVPAPERPKLVLFLVVDQLRGDYLPRYESRLGEGGFRRLRREGVWYADAHYRHATTFTAAGHATLVTGAGPSGHGMAANNWAERATLERVYCVEDARQHLLDRPETKPHTGTSPRNLDTLTIGDELILASGGAARVFGVSFKDRGAILPAGKLGKAFWYSKLTGGFTSSSYYYPALPEWAEAWNGPHAAGGAFTWDLSAPREGYVYADQDDRDFELPPSGMGRTFPHEVDAEHARGAISSTPLADELTVAFALELLAREGLGRGTATDMLAISLSCTDYIGHAFGPNSLEAEDNFLRLDATLERLLDGVDATVGLARTVVVLSSDHGVAAAPEHVNRGTECGDAQAGRFLADELLAEVEAEVRRDLGAPAGGERWAPVYWNPCVYLDEAAIRAAGRYPDVVARAFAARFAERPGIAWAFPRADLERGLVPHTRVGDAVMRAFHRTRSGDVTLVPAPNWQVAAVRDEDATMHGTPWSYDTHVPILLAGPGLGHGVVRERVAPSDIAPTLAVLLGIEAPPACDGRVLPGALVR
ncbi:MAG: alkaline phosphatase family protein [Planctomycetes bacterium]|nr:alkaline phosphatase family protein [Planctomycetota bacterium]